MFGNYLKVAFRNIRRYKLFSFINIAGLALGMACFLLIVYFVRFERGYDTFHKNHENIYLVVRDNQAADYTESRTNTGAPLGPLLTETIPQIQGAVRFTNFRGELVGSENRQFLERKFFFADESVLEVFDFPLLLGSPASALRDPFSVLLTERTAKKYFGDGDPLDKILKYNFNGRIQDFRVTGILKKLPLQSHLDFDFLASYQSLPPLVGDWFMTNHWDSPTWNYVLLAPGASVHEVNGLLSSVTQEHVDRTSFMEIDHHLLALQDVYFDSPGPMPGPRGDVSFLNILTIIALFILLIACFNFMNLSTSRSGARAGEIGLRKVVGARRGQLISQFVGESVLLSVLGLVLALGLVQLLLPAFNAFVGKDLNINYFGDAPFLLIMVVTAAAVGVLAGSYPAFVLSAFKPMSVIRGKASGGKSGAPVVRKALVIGQFAISIGLIVTVTFIVKQVRFLKGMEIGFDKENVINIPIRDSGVKERFELLKSRWLQNPGVLAVTATSMEPGVGSPNGINMKARNADDLNMTIVYVERDYARTLGLDIAAGRDFSADISTDAVSGLLVNETFVDKLGWTLGNAVGEPVELYFKEEGRTIPLYQTTVVGVLKNFHFRDVMTDMQPILLKIEPRRFRHVLLRIGGGEVPETLEFLKRIWNEFQFSQPFEFTFLADDMNVVFRTIENFGAVIRNAAVLAVLIACLGLFGLASYSIDRRTKEIGIRKILGASSRGLVGLITKEFLLLVAAANFIAWPVTYFYIGGMLRDFPYRTGMSPWVFVLSGTLALVIAVLTVIVLSVRAALANPVDTLRYE
jgi:putative ABC transport system permease protein